MLFKQARLFQLTDSAYYSPEKLADKLEQLAFRECPPSMPLSSGWVSPIDEDHAPLIQMMNGYIMICLQVEEKILPAVVIRQELNKKIKKIEVNENRKVSQKEKYALKDEIIVTLLSRAFSRLTKVYAYIDIKNNLLILGTTNEKKTEQFLSIIKKTVGDKIQSFEINKLSYTLTHWLQHKSYPTSFSIEKSCVLQDPNQENRVIRCQQQDLFAGSIQLLIKEGCQIKQIALEWQDRVSFVLVDDFSLQSIQFKDEIIEQVKEMEPETTQQIFNADFLIMTETMSSLFKELSTLLAKPLKLEEMKPNVSNVISMVKRG